VGGAIRKL